MKFLPIGITALIIGGCAAITADPWGWLDDPEQQYWSDITIHGYGREIRFAVPDRWKPGGEHVRRWPKLEKGQRDQVVETTGISLYEPAIRLLIFHWDWYWQGFYKKGDYDFYLDVWVQYLEGQPQLLDLTPDQRVRRQVDYWQNVYDETDSITLKMKAYFFDEYRVAPYQNKHSVVWIHENQPQITADHEIYRIPISDHHELTFSFFVRENRFDLKDDPAWNQRRWEMTRKIMDTVQIIPNPYGDSD